MSEAPKKRWYVVQAFSGFEGRVATSLREHIKLHNMEELFGEVMVPTEEVVEIRCGQQVHRRQCPVIAPVSGQKQGVKCQPVSVSGVIVSDRPFSPEQFLDPLPKCGSQPPVKFRFSCHRPASLYSHHVISARACF